LCMKKVSLNWWFVTVVYILIHFILRCIRKISKNRQLVALSASFRMERLDSHWMDFHKIWYLNIFHKSVEKIQV
jgi:hypothetical protein